MNNIKAHIRMEERYQGLSLVFQDEGLKSKIWDSIEMVKSEMGQLPLVFEKISKTNKDAQTIHIEFRDDVHREGGAFLTMVLQKLHIDKCEKDI